MSAIDFPASPTTGQNFTAGNGVTYQWNGTFWIVLSASQPVAQTVGFYAKNSAQVNFAGATNTLVKPDVIVSGNEGGWYNISTGRFTPPAGRYRIYGMVCGWWAGGATQINVYLRRNGTDWLIAAQQVPGNTNWAGDPMVEVTIDANGTDYFELISSFNNSGQVPKDYLFFGASTINLQAPYIPAVYYGAFEAGDVKGVAHNLTPTGWYECDGSAKSRVTDASLFAAIGTTWGAGDGVNTFNLPDFRGRVLAHIDGGAGRLGSGSAGGVTTGATLGATGGQQAHVQTPTEMAAHQHAYAVGGVVANGVNVRGTSGDGTNLGYAYTEVSGGNGAANITQPTAVIRYLIKR